MTVALLSSLGGMRYDASMQVSDRRVKAGDAFSVHMEVSERGAGRFRISGPFVDLPIGRMRTRFAIPRLASGESAVMDVRHVAEARAVLRIGPPLIRQGDPFGFICRERPLTTHACVFVHPATVRLVLPRTGVSHDFEGLANGRVVSDDLDLHGLRPYEFGDDIRHAHWLSSAKSGRLMIRQYEETCRSDTSLTLDVAADHYDSPEEFELAVSVHASIGIACLEQERAIAMHAGTTHIMPHDALALLDAASAIRRNVGDSSDTDDAVSVDVADRTNSADTGTRPRHATADADADADSVGTRTPPHQATADAANLMGETVRYTPRASRYVLVTGSRTSLDRIAHAVMALPHSARRVVVRAALGGSGDVRDLAGFTIVAVGSLDGLPPFSEVII
ncbi:hypothetical protein BLEM_1481 [Bifidobacterium lemurum]|uniref:DUF58 domain-containing protein n=2 Tax=Bifidobacterium lemurum TaxID=1603886 RepID=A0A261FQ55_9BIFI|nr:DUF58 domain-containing protein [Bifidobacterium lemurum]OZG61269.1 hypothetical protein BLEM_1481 [Bifidobacterium lemurum]